MAPEQLDGSTQPSSGDTVAPQATGLAGVQAPAPEPAGLAQTPATELGGGQEPAAPLTMEALADRLGTVEKRFSDAQAKITTQAEEIKAYRQALAAPRTPSLSQQPAYQPAPPVGYDPYQGAEQFQQTYEPTPYPGAPAPGGLQQRPVQDLVLEGLAGRVHELTLEQRMTQAEEAIGFRLSGQEKQSLLDYMRTVRPGDTDLASGAQTLFFDRALKAREKAGRDQALREVQKAQTAAAPAPAGRPGEPQRQSRGGGSFGEFSSIMEDELKRANL